MSENPNYTHWEHQTNATPDNLWEEAYLRFETPEQEIKKFQYRLKRLGCETWPKNCKIIELFCGRGNGLVALSRLGFQSLVGVDLSPELLNSYVGQAKLYCGDCRNLSLPDSSFDIAIIHGGLHHLPDVGADLDAVLMEIKRVLKTGGAFGLVEPWPTPFLFLVHGITEIPLVRKIWTKGDAFAAMTEREWRGYWQWMAHREHVQNALQRHFKVGKMETGLGKLYFTGIKSA